MQEKKKIHFSDCNYASIAPLETILKISEDMITAFLGELSLDNMTLRTKHHAMWVFTRNKAHVIKKPVYDQTLLLKCQIAKTNALFAYLKTEFYDESGVLLLDILTEICAIDIQTSRFLRLNSLAFPIVTSDIDTSYEFQDIVYDEEMTRVVLPSMLDSSMHLNNVKSIPMYFDTFTLEELDAFYSRPYDFLIKYNSQGKYKEDLILHKGHKDNVYAFELTGSDARSIVKAQFQYH